MMLKLLLLIAVVFFLLSLVRNSRRPDEPRQRADARPRPAPPVQQDMVECPVCRVHLPRTDALPGPDGRLYCCAEHRQQSRS